MKPKSGLPFSEDGVRTLTYILLLCLCLLPFAVYAGHVPMILFYLSGILLFVGALVYARRMIAKRED